jgi:hypothetical protein
MTITSGRDRGSTEPPPEIYRSPRKAEGIR